MTATVSALARPRALTLHGCVPRVVEQRIQRLASTRGTRRRRCDTVCRRRESASRGDAASDRTTIRFKLFGADVSVPQNSVWLLALPTAALLGTAALVGPLVIALAAGGLALGAAASAGALALSAMLLPFGLLSLMGFSALGFFIVPSLFVALTSTALVGGALMLGFGAVTWLLAAQNSDGGRVGAADLSDTSSWTEATQADRAADEEAQRVQRELREFDDLLAQRAREQRRRSGSGRGY